MQKTSDPVKIGIKRRHEDFTEAEVDAGVSALGKAIKRIKSAYIEYCAATDELAQASVNLMVDVTLARDEESDGQASVHESEEGQAKEHF